MKANPSFLGCALFFFAVGPFSTVALGQAVTSTPVATNEWDFYIKILVGILTILGALFGLPIVFLNYRKTRAEIEKLSLEAAVLRGKMPEGTPARVDAGSMRFSVENSPNTQLFIQADPRFLAPLLVLMDFIFAWILYVFSGYLLSFFELKIIETIIMTVLVVLLFFPILREIITLRTNLTSSLSLGRADRYLQQAKILGYIVYSSATILALGFGALVLWMGWSGERVTSLGYFFGWTCFGIGLILALAAFHIKTWADNYFSSLMKPRKDGPDGVPSS